MRSNYDSIWGTSKFSFLVFSPYSVRSCENVEPVVTVSRGLGVSSRRALAGSGRVRSAPLTPILVFIFPSMPAFVFNCIVNTTCGRCVFIASNVAGRYVKKVKVKIEDCGGYMNFLRYLTCYVWMIWS